MTFSRKDRQRYIVRHKAEQTFMVDTFFLKILLRTQAGCPAESELVALLTNALFTTFLAAFNSQCAKLSGNILCKRIIYDVFPKVEDMCIHMVSILGIFIDNLMWNLHNLLDLNL